MLSVYRDLGVILREGRDDNYNRPGQDLSAYQVVRRGDLVLNKMKTWQGSLGMSELDGIVSPAYFVAQQTSDDDPRYLHYALRSLPMIAEYAKRSKGIRPAQWDLPWDEFADVEIRLPRPDQQRLVADLLDRETTRIDKLIAAKRRFRELLDARDASAVSDLTVPIDCRFVRLRFLARLQTGVTVDAGRELGQSVVSVPYLRVANVQAGWLDLADVTEITVTCDLAERSTLRRGDVLMTEGGDLDKLGRGTLWEGQLERCLHQNHIFAVRPATDRLDPRFLALLTRSSHARRYFEMTGSRVTNLASTNSEKILNLPVPQLSLDEQRRLVTKYERVATKLGRLVSAVDRQIQALAERRQSLIAEAIAGQPQPTDAA